MRGRTPKPEELKDLQGRPGRRASARAVTELSTLAVERPRELKGKARQAWERMAPELERLRFLRPADVQAFARYCQHLVRWWELTRQIEKAGGETYVSASQHGELKRVHPAFLVRDRIEGRMVDLEDRFGLSPRARQQILQQLAAQGSLFPDAPKPSDAERPAEDRPAPVGFLNGGSMH